MSQLLAIWKDFPQQGVGFLELEKASELYEEASTIVSSCRSELWEGQRAIEDAEKNAETDDVKKSARYAQNKLAIVNMCFGSYLTHFMVSMRSPDPARPH